MYQNLRQRVCADDKAGLITVGLEIARYHRLCKFSTIHGITASTHPSVVSGCQSMDEDAARIHLADAVRLASPLGEIFPSQIPNDFLLKCKIFAIERRSIYQGKHFLKEAMIITADVDLLVEAQRKTS